MRKRKTTNKNIPIIAGVVGCIALLSTVAFLFSRSKRLDAPPNSTPEKQTIQIEEPKYSVEITASDVITSPHSVSYQATLTNTSVEPYITNFALSQCQLEDDGGNTYQGQLTTETIFDPAIMPGESKTIAVNASVSISGYTNSGNGFEKCEYDADGVKRCGSLSKLSVKSCTAYITTDDSQASNEWGDYPLNVTFPRSMK
jgi:hypothetical protein